METVAIFNILRNVPQISEEHAHELAEAIGGKTDLVTKTDLKAHLAELEVKLIKWMAGINIATAGLIIAIIKLL